MLKIRSFRRGKTPREGSKRESGEEWLIKLASSGLTTVTDVNRGSVPTIDDSQPKTGRSARKRPLPERFFSNEERLGGRLRLVFRKVEVKNGSVLRNALERTFTLVEEEE